MSQPFVLNLVPRRRGNPNWEKPMEPAPNIPTAFEEQVKLLGLSEQACVTSAALKYWCERNKDRCYIPESLLNRWGLVVDPCFADFRPQAKLRLGSVTHKGSL